MTNATALEVAGLSYSYRDKLVFEGLNLRIEDGGCLGILGPNGAGKTTLIKCMIGALRARTGSVSLWGRDVTKLPLWRRARLGLGYLSQGGSLIPELSVQENVALGVQTGSKRVVAEDTLSRLDLMALSQRKPQSLSGGERRQIELARLFASAARLLILDEPYAGLDPRARIKISEMLDAFKRQGRTLIITDHDFRTTLKIVKSAVVLVEGKVCCEGNPAKILQDTFVRAHYLGGG